MRLSPRQGTLLKPQDEDQLEKPRYLLTQCDCGDCACDLNDYISNARLGEPLPIPVIYSLELTPLCNNRCPGCSNVFADARRARSSLSAAEWCEVLDVIAPHARRLKVTGGEPTMHPQFWPIVSEIARRDIPFTLFTNARWPDPAAIVAGLRDTPQCTGLLISLHGPDARSHEAFTGVAGSFGETVANIRRAAEARLLVAVSTVLTRHNCAQVEAMVEFACGLGAEHVVFDRYLGAPLPSLEPTPDQLREAVRTIEGMIARGEPLRYGTPVCQCFEANSSVGCLAGLAYCTIDPWGRMRPCNHSPTVVGSVLEQPLEELWHSETMRRWRDLAPAACHACAAFATCRGGCKAMAEIRPERCDPLVCTYLLRGQAASVVPTSTERSSRLTSEAHALL